MGNFMERLNESVIEHIKSEYGDRFEVLAKHFTDFDDEKAMKLGVLLENTNQAFSRTPLFESTQVGDIANGIKNQYFDIISASFPGLISEELFSIQPLRQKAGQIFWLKYVYGSNKGSIKRGDTMFGPFGQIGGYDKRNYSSEVVEDESLHSGDGTTKKFTGNLGYYPVQPGTVKIQAGLAEPIVDDGNGVLKATGISDSTINYENGAYEITFATAPANTTDIIATYLYDASYAPSNLIPEIELRVEDKLIEAHPRKLRGTYSLDAAYDLKMAQGIDISESLLSAASMSLRHETDGELLMDAYNQARNSSSISLTYNPSTAEISIEDFYLAFLDGIVKASSIIRKATKRVEANWLVVGKRGADMLRVIGAPRFVASGNTTAAGPCYIGTLLGQWKVYINPFFEDNQFLLGYRGDTLVDAGLIYAPYLPFFTTDPVMLDDFLGRRGFATIYGKRMVNPDMYVKGVILGE